MFTDRVAVDEASGFWVVVAVVVVDEGSFVVVVFGGVAEGVEVGGVAVLFEGFSVRRVVVEGSPTALYPKEGCAVLLGIVAVVEVFHVVSVLIVEAHHENSCCYRLGGIPEVTFGGEGWACVAGVCGIEFGNL